MGSAFSSSSSEDESSRVAPVILNVYDLNPLNDYLYWCGLGIFHSGIEVHGSEYGFGAHDFPTSGVFEVEPRNCPDFVYRCSILLGYTNMPPSAFWTFLESMVSEYYGDTYHLISKNCNHFTEDICFRLTGKHIPGWINRLARMVSSMPCNSAILSIRALHHAIILPVEAQCWMFQPRFIPEHRRGQEGRGILGCFHNLLICMIFEGACHELFYTIVSYVSDTFKLPFTNFQIDMVQKYGGCGCLYAAIYFPLLTSILLLFRNWLSSLRC